MLSLGVKVYVLAAEINPDVAKMAEASLDQIVHCSSSRAHQCPHDRGHHEEEVHPGHRGGRRQPLPGQHLPQQEPEGARRPAVPPTQRAQSASGTSSRRTYPKTPVLTFLENVASSPQQVKQEYDQPHGSSSPSASTPASSAGCSGSVSTGRLGPRGETWRGTTPALPDDVKLTWDGDSCPRPATAASPSLRTSGRTGWLRVVRQAKPEQVVQRWRRRGAMYPFTREF